MAITKDNHDDSMSFENLARAVFKCGRYGDSWGYASADEATNLYKASEKGKIMLYTIIDIAIHENNNKEELVASLLKIKEDTIKASEKDNLMKIVNSLIDLLNNNY